MDAADHRKQRFMFIKHLMQICEGICRGLKLVITVHKMTGIEHEPFFCIMNLCKQPFGDSGIEHIQTGPPEIFHQKPERIVVPVEQFIDKGSCGIHDLCVRMLHFINKRLCKADLCHVEDNVFRVYEAGIFQIFSVMFDQHVLIQIHPVCDAAQMDADNHILFNQMRRILAKRHQLESGKPKGLVKTAQVCGIRVTSEIICFKRKIHGDFHNEILSFIIDNRYGDGNYIHTFLEKCKPEIFLPSEKTPPSFIALPQKPCYDNRGKRSCIL